MKQISLLLLGLFLFQQGCALVPLQDKSHKHHKIVKSEKKSQEHKSAQKLSKPDRDHGALKERITLVDFKIFSKDQHKSKKHHKKKQNVVTTGSVGASFFPLGFQFIEIPQQGISIGSFLVEHEMSTAVLATQAIIGEKINGAATDAARNGENASEAAQEIEKKEKEKVIGFPDLHPDVIILQRGQITTIFPRRFLAVPQVANISIVPNDLVVTRDIEKNGLKNSILTNTSPQKKNREFTLSGFTKKPGRSQTGAGQQTVDAITRKYSSAFDENTFAVTVVYRRYQDQLYQILLPNYSYGILRRHPDPKSDADANTEKAIEEAQEKWDDYYKVFSIMAIQEGDVIEFTTLDLMNLTSPLNAALMVP